MLAGVGAAAGAEADCHAVVAGVGDGLGAAHFRFWVFGLEWLVARKIPVW